MSLRSVLAVFAVSTTKKATLIVLGWTALMMACELLSLLEDLAWLSVGVLVLLGVGAVLVGLFVVEYVRVVLACRQMDKMRVTRILDANLPVHELSPVVLSVHHDESDLYKNLTLTLTDHYPPITQAQALPVRLSTSELSDGATLHITYQIYANERGLGVFGGVDWSVGTSWGLLQKFYHTPKEQVAGVSEVRVLANFKAVIQGNLFAISKKASNGGVIKRKRQGQGRDFHQIRSYDEGDSIRHIDWKATARHQRLMSKEYQDEADQEILFLLDCGQHMRHMRFDDDTRLDKAVHDGFDEGILPKVSHLDMALNAMLLLAEVANRQADATGFISFGAVVDKIVPPKKGTKVISHLLNQSFKLQASMNAPDYMAVARQALSLQRRRSLLVMITNIGTDNSEEVAEALQLLTKKHRVILVNLYESDLSAYLRTLPQTADDALTYQGVQSYLNAQKQLNARLGKETGALVISSTPDALPHKLLDGYWLVRQQGVV